MEIDKLEREMTEPAKAMPIEELMTLDGFNGVNSYKVFGLELEQDTTPPYVQSLIVIEMTLGGASIDNSPFQLDSFSALTDGLTLDGKVRMVVILQHYSNEIDKKISCFQEPSTSPIQLTPPMSYDGLMHARFQTIKSNSQALESAKKWIEDIMNSIDDETIDACRKLGNPDFFTALEMIDGFLVEPADEPIKPPTVADQIAAARITINKYLNGDLF